MTLEDAAVKGEHEAKLLPLQGISYFPVELPAERATTLALLVRGRKYWPKRGNGDPWTGNARPSSQDTTETDSGGEIRLYRSNSPNGSRQTVRGSMEGRTARSRCAMPNSQHEPDGGTPPERAVQHGAVSAYAFPHAARERLRLQLGCNRATSHERLNLNVRPANGPVPTAKDGTKHS